MRLFMSRLSARRSEKGLTGRGRQGCLDSSRLALYGNSKSLGLDNGGSSVFYLISIIHTFLPICSRN